MNAFVERYERDGRIRSIGYDEGALAIVDGVERVERFVTDVTISSGISDGVDLAIARSGAHLPPTVRKLGLIGSRHRRSVGHPPAQDGSCHSPCSIPPMR